MIRNDDLESSSSGTEEDDILCKMEELLPPGKEGVIQQNTTRFWTVSADTKKPAKIAPYEMLSFEVGV